MKARTGLALLLVALGAAIACSARTSESTATTTVRLKLGDNERISEGAGFTTASVAVHEGGGDFIGGPWGRYDGLGINPKVGRFVAAWADNRNDGAPGTRTEIWSAEVVP